MSATARKVDFSAWPFAGQLARLLDVLDRDGEEARVVGGAVRNALIGMPVHEVDVATTAVPEEVVRRAKAAGFRPVPTGIDHGTITVVIDKHPFEVTTLRTDVETFGRHAKVAFGRDWREDALRRDFTMNALSASRDGTVYDYAGGLADLEARRVRFIGDARRRIEEDYLRILRFFRFHAAYGHGHPDADGLAACIYERGGLDQLSRERVRMEMLKLVVAPRAAPTLAAMAQTGLLLRVLGGVPYLAAFENMAKAEAVVGLRPDAARRLGALGVVITEDAERLSQKLRLSNAEHTRLTAMAENWLRFSPRAGEGAARALLYRLKETAYTDSALMAWARSQASDHDAPWRELVTLPQRWTPPVFPLKAADFMSRGIEKGPALGAALRAAEEAWIAAGFPAEEATLAAIADAGAAGT
ncbi:CCA tRNA nucleotidyltransferase [Pseudolabrys sp. FHR47]|uniref:CCA tRNA nucleotidyltransferase n=1 Tax=Pseudolabrys sp. FHR47 TaxID=2562284 RepID=UPI0010BEDF8E|nr:CCA tRNA nucleotidyltransferase [Pseudolabrys sp. FHR47]